MSEYESAKLLQNTQAWNALRNNRGYYDRLNEILAEPKYNTQEELNRTQFFLNLLNPNFMPPAPKTAPEQIAKKEAPEAKTKKEEPTQESGTSHFHRQSAQINSINDAKKNTTPQQEGYGVFNNTIHTKEIRKSEVVYVGDIPAQNLESEESINNRFNEAKDALKEQFKAAGVSKVSPHKTIAGRFLMAAEHTHRLNESLLIDKTRNFKIYDKREDNTPTPN
ncbi:MAG: hypothetical protein KTR28_08125 [Micavibrio sp.]|nr:hypothetical protein [Micavibrio sp.]